MQHLVLDSKKSFGLHGAGNQIKKWEGNWMIKINSEKREANKEVSAYILCKAFGVPCAVYELMDVEYKGHIRRACRTLRYDTPMEEKISVYQILEAQGVAITSKMPAIEYIQNTIIAISVYTGINKRDVATWLYSMLVFDYLICNADRHLTNFEVLHNVETDTFRLVPYYDHGDSFLGVDRKITESEYTGLERKFKTRPFSTNPEKNIGDHCIARSVFIRMMNNIGGINGIMSLNILDGHKYIVLKRIKKLEQVLQM